MRRLVPLVFVLGCVDTPDVDSIAQPLVAYCEVMVQGQPAPIDIETDYLPHVVNCENGGAAFEALKAQAVAARTYLYYKLDRSGTIADGTSDQVYSCGREPREEIYEAVRQTQGVVLQYTGRTIAGFFVAGSRNQPPPECRGSTDDPTNTERYVTYNEGLSGDGITQTRLGFVDPTNLYNRGCLSQNGSHCLAGVGYGYEDMLRFYYGADIEIVVAEGSCVEPMDAGVEEPDATMGLPDVGVAFDAGPSVAFDGGPSVEVIAPSGSGASLSSGCSAGGAVAFPWWLLAIALPRRRR